MKKNKNFCPVCLKNKKHVPMQRKAERSMVSAFVFITWVCPVCGHSYGRM